MFLAGYETSANALSFAIHCLSHHPKVRHIGVCACSSTRDSVGFQLMRAHSAALSTGLSFGCAGRGQVAGRDRCDQGSGAFPRTWFSRSRLGLLGGWDDLLDGSVGAFSLRGMDSTVWASNQAREGTDCQSYLPRTTHSQSHFFSRWSWNRWISSSTPRPS